MAVAYGTLSFSDTIGWLVVASTFAAFGNGIARPVLTSLITQAAGRHEQGVVIGLNQSLMSVAQICAPPLAGTLIGTGRLGLWAMVAALASALGVVMSRWGSAKVARAPLSAK